MKKDEVIHFDGNKWTKKSTTIAKEPIIGDLWEEVKKRYSILSKIYRKFGISMTGGQDSRLSLALLTSLGIQPTLYYGEGDSLVTCTKKEIERLLKK